MICKTLPFSAATFLITMSALASELPPGPQPPDAIKVLALDVFKSLVQINTTHAHGSTQAAEQLAARLRASGFAPEDVTLIAPADHPTKGNLVIRLHGQGKGKPLLFIGHLDVVEAKREDWSVDPFLLTEKDGYFYGRGTLDMKDDDAALVTSLMRFKQEGFVPERDIVVARLRCLQRARFRLLEVRGAIGLLLAEAFIEGVAPVFVDIVEPVGQRRVDQGRIVLVAGHLGRVGLATPEGGVRVGGNVIPREIFGMVSHASMMEERPGTPPSGLVSACASGAVNVGRVPRAVPCTGSRSRTRSARQRPSGGP